MALDGKTAIVTGAAMGIGKAITEILLKNGAKVKIKLGLGFLSCVCVRARVCGRGGDYVCACFKQWCRKY